MNNFFKMSLKALTLPVFVIRVVNGALIRFFPAELMLCYYISGRSGSDDKVSMQFWIMVGIISLVWSFLYAVSTPSVPKLSYMYRNYPQKIQNLLKKRVAYWIAFVLFGIGYFVNSTELTFYAIIYFWYVLVSITINTILMLVITTMGYNPFFEELCYKKSNDYENRTLEEFYTESGMGEILSKDGLKQAMNGLKSGLKKGKRR